MAMSVGSASEDDVMVDINTTPLIDVMLVLLIMFIITIPIQTHAVKLNMPTPSNVQPTKLPEVMRIDVDFDGTIGVNGVLTTKSELDAKLGEWGRLPTADQPEVHLRPNKLVTYKHVAAIMASAQRQGVSKIGMVGNEQFMN
ncbi:MAG: biopolymer transporter ExbD [Aquincola sp.]|nr:biopolymer transporter ExbD [Aquincola sp.]MDH5328600.1 biopolymer transporter ExbD [Aquincola sp.]